MTAQSVHFEQHPDAADLVEVTRYLAMEQGRSPAQIIAWLLEAYSEEPPQTPPGEVPPAADVDEASAAVEESGPRPAVHDS